MFIANHIFSIKNAILFGFPYLVNKSNASRYLAAVFAITSAGTVDYTGGEEVKTNN